MPDKPLKYREMIRCVTAFGIQEDVRGGKGSHRMLRAMVDGKMVSYPVPCHTEGYELSASVIRAIRRRFKLTSDDGVADGDFYL